ncbi:MAG: hypothetical protein RLY31_2780 [Bacteroidota bacterium]|jgi:small-conductance mechanosensitive channel
MNFSEWLDYSLISTKKLSLDIGDIFNILLVILTARLLKWSMEKVFLKRIFLRRNTDEGRRRAMVQVTNYVIYFLAIFVVLELLGIATMIWASSAALLVGIGLGLQDSFKDLISGIILLIEGTIEIGDIIEVDGMVTRVQAIGLRTTQAESRDRVVILIPNSKLIVEKVVNWSHNDYPTRFNIDVGVAYGSDLTLVMRLLKEAAQNHPKVLSSKPIHALFNRFGDSSLDFRLYFFSDEFFGIEQVRSDIMLEVDRLFRMHHVQIPFPQRDLWLRQALPAADSRPSEGSADHGN